MARPHNVDPARLNFRPPAFLSGVGVGVGEATGSGDSCVGEPKSRPPPVIYRWSGFDAILPPVSPIEVGVGGAVVTGLPGAAAFRPSSYQTTATIATIPAVTATLRYAFILPLYGTKYTQGV